MLRSAERRGEGQ